MSFEKLEKLIEKLTFKTVLELKNGPLIDSLMNISSFV